MAWTRMLGLAGSLRLEVVVALASQGGWVWPSVGMVQGTPPGF